MDDSERVVDADAIRSSRLPQSASNYQPTSVVEDGANEGVPEAASARPGQQQLQDTDVPSVNHRSRRQPPKVVTGESEALSPRRLRSQTATTARPSHTAFSHRASPVGEDTSNKEIPSSARAPQRPQGTLDVASRAGIGVEKSHRKLRSQSSRPDISHQASLQHSENALASEGNVDHQRLHQPTEKHNVPFTDEQASRSTGSALNSSIDVTSQWINNNDLSTLPREVSRSRSTQNNVPGVLVAQDDVQHALDSVRGYPVQSDPTPLGLNDAATSEASQPVILDTANVGDLKSLCQHLEAERDQARRDAIVLATVYMVLHSKSTDASKTAFDSLRKNIREWYETTKSSNAQTRDGGTVADRDTEIRKRDTRFPA